MPASLPAPARFFSVLGPKPVLKCRIRSWQKSLPCYPGLLAGLKIIVAGADRPIGLALMPPLTRRADQLQTESLVWIPGFKGLAELTLPVLR